MKKPTLKSVFDSSVVCCDVEALAHGYALSGSNPILAHTNTVEGILQPSRGGLPPCASPFGRLAP